MEDGPSLHIKYTVCSSLVWFVCYTERGWRKTRDDVVNTVSEQWGRNEEHFLVRVPES